MPAGALQGRGEGEDGLRMSGDGIRLLAVFPTFCPQLEPQDPQTVRPVAVHIGSTWYHRLGKGTVLPEAEGIQAPSLCPVAPCIQSQ